MKKKLKKKRKIYDRSSLARTSPQDIVYLESLLRTACYTRDNWRCLRCRSKTNQLNMSHIYPKGRYRSMRFELINVKALCAWCHMEFWHRNPAESGNWFRETYPDWYEEVKKMSQDANRPKFDYERIKAELLKLPRRERPN